MVPWKYHHHVVTLLPVSSESPLANHALACIVDTILQSPPNTSFEDLGSLTQLLEP